MKVRNELYVVLSLSSIQYHRTPVHAAAKGGYTEIVQLLIQAGADVNVKDAVCVTTSDSITFTRFKPSERFTC